MRVKIKRIEVVPGSDLNKNWRDKMQKVHTNKGMFIDTMYAPHDFYKDEGDDWSFEIGETVEVRIKQHQATQL